MRSLLAVSGQRYFFYSYKSTNTDATCLPGGRVEGKSKTEKSEKASVKKEVVKKDVSHLDETIKQWGEVEVYTMGDWWNARIERIVQVTCFTSTKALALLVQKHLLYRCTSANTGGTRASKE